MILNYDVIVVGGGHAGCEAAAAAANMGATTLLITMDMTKFAMMSCNPAVGGVAKGQIVREIDALGGQMGVITDKSTIQFRMLNRSKGPAMWSPRAQCDKIRFTDNWRMLLENTENLYLWQDSVVEIIEEQGKVTGVKTRMGLSFAAKSVILTNGTFLNGLIHTGRVQVAGGRAGDEASYGLSDQLEKLGFEVGRMKTGTPARLDGRTIDFDKIEAQYGDGNEDKFSYDPSVNTELEQKPCYIVYTSLNVHDTLRTGFAESPLFNGTIKGIGPRYCPSIEDKLRTFADKDQHQLFLEPEGATTNEYYLNGFSSSLPWQVQIEALRQIKGLENVHLFRTGYAIEYDYFPPTQLYHTLETKLIENLYFAGQINGTTGYEEAGAQGLMAAINAVLKQQNKEPFILRRDQAYIGVLIDDLVTKGVDEPYRMFTSRAEHRILLRGDNADLRLTPLAYELGLASKEQYDRVIEKDAQVNAFIEYTKNTSISQEQSNDYLISVDSSPLTQGRKLYDLLLRSEVETSSLRAAFAPLNEFITEHSISEGAIEQAEIQIKYKGYIDREMVIADKLTRLENISIPSTFDYNSVNSLSIESRQKLTKIKPATIGQASRIPGVSPADINVLLIKFKR
ncbi:MAG: tRNA uridine-5-carboxymethylaminomethyl(34) synthesis enzyme MnmG [Rikenellaceae bacterium]